jgi:hypothetical protein
MKTELRKSAANTHMSATFPHFFSRSGRRQPAAGSRSAVYVRRVTKAIHFCRMFRSWGKEKEVDKVVDFFAKDHGTVVVSEAVCLTHKVDIADR